jgi:hypothetical protein
MKVATAIILLACAVAPAAPATAARLSLAKSVKLCEAELAKMTPPPKLHRFDDYESRSSETHFWLVFNIRTGDDRSNKLFCKVDRKASTTEITTKWPL